MKQVALMQENKSTSHLPSIRKLPDELNMEAVRRCPHLHPAASMSHTDANEDREVTSSACGTKRGLRCSFRVTTFSRAFKGEAACKNVGTQPLSHLQGLPCCLDLHLDGLWGPFIKTISCCSMCLVQKLQ